MDASLCSVCKIKKGLVGCGNCQCLICKKCSQYVKKNSFAMLEPIPGELTHENYCPPCFITKIGPTLDAYNDAVQRAKDVLVFYRSRGDETRVVRSAEKPYKVTGCSDQPSTLLKLAFKAAQNDFNALLDVTFQSHKIRNGGYQTLRWDGVGIPAKVDAAKYPTERP